MLYGGKEYVVEVDGQTYHCALDLTMGFVGGKWKTVILWYLRGGPLRFSALKQRIPDITEKMLSLQLKALETDGLVRREVFAEVPPRVEYSQTEFGASLNPVLEAMAQWAQGVAKTRGTLIEVQRGS